jgi:hypothetical protein
VKIGRQVWLDITCLLYKTTSPSNSKRTSTAQQTPRRVFYTFRKCPQWLKLCDQCCTVLGWCCRHFRFKSWFVPAIQVRTLNGLYIGRFVACKRLKRKPVSSVNAVMALRNLSLGKTFCNCLVGRSFATECCCMKHETLLLFRKWFMQ